MPSESTKLKQAELQLVATGDGSPTCRAGDDGELFHNPAGAWTEAWQHYALPAAAGNARALDGTGLAWLDVCFGLGYGTWALAQKLQAHRSAPEALEVLAYESDERLCSLWPDLVQRLVDTGHLSAGVRLEEDAQAPDPSMRSFRLESSHGTWATIQVRIGDFREALAQLETSVDWILHDPFSPQRFPQLWTAEIFAHYQRMLAGRRGRLLTYSTASAVLSGLESAGLTLYRTPALGLKRGGTVAIAGKLDEPLPQGIAELPLSDLAALATRSGMPYRDATLRGDAYAVSSERNAAQRTSLLPGRSPLSE